MRGSEAHWRPVRVAAAALALTVLAIGADVARAESQDAARRYYAEGARLYEQRDYARAIRAFERAYEISGSPALLFNLGQANRLADRCAKALEYYELYLRLDKDAPNRSESERRVAEMRSCITRPSDAGAGELAEPDAASSAAVSPVPAPPSRPPAAVDSGGPPAAPPTPPSGTGGQPTDRPSPAAAYVLGAVGIAGLAMFATFGLLGRSDQRNLESTCSPRCAPADVDAMRSKFLIADLALVAGVVSLGAATYIVVARDSQRGAFVGVSHSF